ncbi:AAA family ATPase [candidate division KSB1 bacterium]|nr:AAA family ATPase [candidate division KSB1 bacterium]
MIIGLTGTNASGKTSILKYLISRGFEHHSLSDAIRAELTWRKMEHSRENMRLVGNELRERFGPSVLAVLIKKEIISANAVIDSIRNTYEVIELRKLPDFRLIALDAPVEIRFKRAMKRGRQENAVTVDSFRELEEREKSKDATAQNIDQCMQLADFHIYNDGTIEDLHAKLDHIIKEAFP